VHTVTSWYLYLVNASLSVCSRCLWMISSQAYCCFVLHRYFNSGWGYCCHILTVCILLCSVVVLVTCVVHAGVTLLLVWMSWQLISLCQCLLCTAFVKPCLLFSVVIYCIYSFRWTVIFNTSTVRDVPQNVCLTSIDIPPGRVSRHTNIQEEL